MNYFLVKDGQTEGDAQEPTMHEHRWAQKVYKLIYIGAPDFEFVAPMPNQSKNTTMHFTED